MKIFTESLVREVFFMRRSSFGCGSDFVFILLMDEKPRVNFCCADLLSLLKQKMTGSNSLSMLGDHEMTLSHRLLASGFVTNFMKIEP